MKKITTIAAAVALAGAAVSANAWWGYPSGTPYGAGFAPMYGYPAVMTEEQQKAVAQQQQAFAEQQAKMLQQAVEAQRQFAAQMVRQQAVLVEQWRENGIDPMTMDPFSGFDPFIQDPMASVDESLTPDTKELIEQSDAEFRKVRERNQARRDAFKKRVEERRNMLRERRHAFPFETALEKTT